MPRARLALLLLLAAPAHLRAADPDTADVFVPKTDGFKSIRIPAAVVTNKGTLLAFAEGRAADADQAKNKIIAKRSTDGGKTWGKVAVIADGGDRALNNPCAVVERGSGQVLLMYQSYPAGVSERSGKIQPGYEGELIVRNWLVTSDDDGVTWGKPRDITRETKREKVVTTVAGGPGVGIQLRHGKHAGRLLFPFNEGPFGVWNVYAVYSDDKGKTWKMGDPAPGGLVEAAKGKTSLVNEAQFVELKDGAVRFNVRRWAGKAVRKTCVSADGGLTWSKVEDAPDLVDPGCMGSVLRYTDPADGRKSRLLYAGPQSTKRENGTVFVSYDEGATWPTKRVLNKGSFAYSCLVALPDGTIGCLYEADNTSKIVFARLTLDWLTDGKDTFEASPVGRWERLPGVPDREGFAGSFAGASGGALLVAGGANFPDKKPWDGGRKVWHDKVFTLEKGGEWRQAGALPRPLGYGVSATHGPAVVCAGGSDSARHYGDCFSLTWNNGTLATAKLPALPKPLANGCGALVGDTLFVAGGQERPDGPALASVWKLDLSAAEPQWAAVEDLPGGGRVLATAASFDGSFWVAGGAALVPGAGGALERKYLRDAYRHTPGRGWARVADLPCPSAAAPSPAPTDAGGFLILGGDDGAQVGTAPDKHTGFRERVLRYDAKADRWAEVGAVPAPRVTVPCVRWGGSWVVPSGEARPGVRSPEVWALAPTR